MEAGKSLQPEDVRNRFDNKETFVVNVVTEWCPDCTQRQRPNLPKFIEKLEAAGLPLYQLSVQKERRVFLSAEHEAITEEFGGHGYPRTVLIINGEIQPDSPIEVLTEEALSELATEFINKVKEN